MKKTNTIKKCISMALSLVLAMTAVVLCAVVTAPEAKAATVRNVSSEAEFEDAFSKYVAGDTINVTKPFEVSHSYTITKSLTLTCSHDSGAKNQDIYRHKDFHGTIFVVDNDATLTLQCCVSGNGKASDSDTNFRGYGYSNKEADGYYGAVLIRLDDGNLVMNSDKSILKNNYNVGTQGDAKWSYDGITYYADANNTYGTKDARTGSAVYGYHGSFTMSAGRIYNCVSDNGPALYFASGYANDKAKISGGLIYNNVARRYGGAIFSIRRENNVYTATQAANFNFSGKRTLDSDGGNAKLTISGDAKIYQNVARLGGGGIWSGHGATLYMTDGEIYKNISTEASGGGIRTNAGDVASINKTSSVCMGLPGGQTKITGGEIYENSAVGDGGGIQVARIDYSVAENDCKDTSIYTNNKFTMTGGTIYNNTATGSGGGIITATQTYISGGRIGSGTSLSRGNKAGGNGGGIYCNAKSHLELTGGSVSYNTSDSDGGGIFLVSGGGASKIVDAEVYNNKAVNGGGVASNRSEGLTVGGSAKVYSNTASNDGGGMYTKGLCNINNGYFYANEPTGVHAQSGTLNIKGGKFGFSEYTDGSTYTVSKNTYSQVVVSSGAECEITDSNSPRFITGITDGETVSDNFGIRNHGTTTASSGKIIFFGKGTSVYNNGTFDVNCSFNIQTTEKAGATTHQERLGVYNTSKGVFTANHSDFEIKYCGNRAIYNEGVFTLVNGNIHDNTVPSTTVNALENKGAGVCNYGAKAKFSLEDGTITNNSAYLGGGIYNGNSGTLSIIGGTISKNTASSGAGVYNTASGSFAMEAGSIESNTSEVSGGGVRNDGAFTMSDGTIKNNKGTEYGGGICSGEDATTTIKGGASIHNNTDTMFGAGVSNTGTLKISDGSIYKNTASEYGGGIFNGGTGTTTVTGGKIHSNTAWYGGGVYVLTGGTATVSGGTIGGTTTTTTDATAPLSNTATHGGGGIANTGTVTVKGKAVVSHNVSNGGAGGGIWNDGTLTVEGIGVHHNSATDAGFGGGIYTYSNGNTTITDAKIYNNIAYCGGGVYNKNQTTINGNAKVYNHSGVSEGGGVFSGESLIVNSGYFYNNDNGGLYVGEGTAIINGGYYGISEYTDDANYTVSRNSKAQIITGVGGEVTVTGADKVRIVSLVDETVTENVGIENNGVFVVTDTCKDFDIYGTGIGIKNYGIINANGAMRITTSEKDGSTTLQNRTGVLNTVHTNGGVGTANINSDTVEISYCGKRGINNQGTLNFAGGLVHDCTTDENNIGGGGIYNNGANSYLNMTGGEVYNNSARLGAGILLSADTKASSVAGGRIHDNTANDPYTIDHYENKYLAGSFGGGIYSVSTKGLTVSKDAEVYNNTANKGGGIYCGGLINIQDGAKVYSNDAIAKAETNPDTSEFVFTGGTGGGIFATTGNIEIDGASVYDNFSDYQGGGLFLYAQNAVTTIKTDFGSTKIYGNKSYCGGGIFNNGELTVTGDTEIYDNHAVVNEDYPEFSKLATRGGGGICNNSTGKVTLGQNASVYSNSAYNGGGIFNNGNCTLKIIGNATVRNNKGTSGGGVYNGGQIEVCDNAEIFENTGSTGGGLCNVGTAGVSGGEIYENSAVNFGGGVYNSRTLTLTGSPVIRNNTSTVHGGGVFTSGETTIENAVIRNNQAATGGGLYVHTANGIAEVIDGEIYNNTATSSGGGVFVSSGSFDMSDGKITGNTAKDSGGGISVGSSATVNITKGEISNNKTQVLHGGGIYTLGTTTLNGSEVVVSGNTAYKMGGGVYAGSGSTFTATNCKVIENTAETGAGIYLLDDSNVTGVLVKDNVVGKVGGGVAVGTLADNTEVNLVDCDITKNKISENNGVEGAGIYAVNTNGKVNVTNCDIHENFATGGSKMGAGVCVRGNVTVDNSRIYDNYAPYGAGMILGTGNFILKDSKIYNNGTYENVDGKTLTTSQGGGIRVTKGNGNLSVKIESTGIYNNRAMNGAGIAATIVDDATVNMANTVNIYNNTADDCGGGIYWLDGNFTLADGLNIYQNKAAFGGGVHWEAETLSVSYGAKIYENSVSNTGGGICVTGANSKLTMTGGKVYNNTALSGGGVALSSDGLESLISNAEIYGNTVAGEPKGGGYGGGVYSLRVNGLTVNNSKIHDNTSSYGGGIYSKADFVVSDSEIYNNNAYIYFDIDENTFPDGYAGGHGGGLYLANPVGSKNEVSIVNTTIHNNFVDYQGGGIYSDTNLTIGSDVNINNNTARIGGGMLSNGVAVITDNAVIAENNAKNSTNEEYNEFFAKKALVVGAGIANNGYGTMTIGKNVVIENNKSDVWGGGVFNNGYATLTICDDVIIRSNKSGNAGGVYNTGKFTLADNVHIYANEATNSGGVGGGMVVANQNNDFTMTGGVIGGNTSEEANKAKFGAGIYFGTNAKNNNLVGGVIKGNVATGDGGGIDVGDKTAEVVLSGEFSINNNQAKRGGGVYNIGLLDIDGISIYKNTATSEGGGFYTQGTVNLNKVSVAKNTANVNAGGIYNASVFNIKNSEISENTGKVNGGGILNSTGTVNLENSLIHDNQTITGGGIYNRSGTVNIKEGTEVYNHTTTGAGAGIYNMGTLNIEDGKVYSNDVATDNEKTVGGGICNMGENSKLNITGGEVSNNTAPRGAGIYIDILTQESLISDAKIHHNTYPVGGVGMGIYNLSTAGLAVRDSEIYSNSSVADLDNEVEWKQSSNGGGIANGGVLTVESTKTTSLLDTSPAMKIYDNHVSNGGGGIYNSVNGTVTIRGGEVCGNSAISLLTDKNGVVKGSGGGGGIANNNSVIIESGNTNGTEVLIHNNLSGNAGSGVFNAGGTKTYLKIISGKIYDNGKLETTVDGVTKEYIGVCGGGVYSAGKFEIEGAEIYNNYVTSSGGGVGVEGTYGDFNSTVTNCIIHDNYAGVQGGGIGGGVGNGSFTVKGGKIYNNSSASGGGVINSGNTKLDAVKIYNNYAVDGAGVYAWSGVFEMVDTEVYENGNLDTTNGKQVTTNGGGVFIRKNDDQAVTITNSLIRDNIAQRGGGINISRTKGAPVNIINTEIDNNNAFTGGGMYLYANAGEITVKDGSVISNNTTTRATNFDSHGGGMLVSAGSTVNVTGGSQIIKNISGDNTEGSGAYGGGAHVRGTLNLSDGVQIRGNRTGTTSVGGGLYVGPKGIVNMLKVDGKEGVSITENVATGSSGGGVFVHSNGTLNIYDGLIENNEAGTGGGGVQAFYNSVVNMTGGVIGQNKAQKTANGVCLGAGALFNMTGGEIRGDSSTSKNYGVYVSGPDENNNYGSAEFRMSKDAIVSGTYTVCLEKDTYISVPEVFNLTEKGNDIRATITGADMSIGRVVAKHTPEPVQATDKDGNPVVDEEGNPVYEENAFGTVALYHDAEKPVMVEQYFALENGKMLRAGNQGASKYTEDNNIVDQDVFITEGYSVNFDMNPEAFTMPDITHTISNVGEWEFPDGLLGGYVNEGVYTKYWYEDLNVNLGNAVSSESDFAGWNTMADGAGTPYEADENASVVGNEDITYYAQWLTEQIEINYLGNGATEGNDFTETDVNSSEEYYNMENGKVDEGDEDVHGRDSNEEVFERIEEVREVVTDENGNPVIDAETGEEVTVVTDTKLFSLEGWSLKQRPGINDTVWNLGQKKVKMELFTNSLQPANANTTMFAMLRSGVATGSAEGKVLEQYEGTNDKSYANVYAVWDQYPKIYAVDRYFTLEEAQAGKITLEELMDTEHAFACDGFDKKGHSIPQLDEEGKVVVDEFGDEIPLWEGQNTNFYDSEKVQATDKDGNLLFDDEGNAVMVDEYIRNDKESFTILDYVAEDFTSLKGSASKTLTFCAVDRAGNMTVKTITVYVTDNSDTDASFFSRFISERYFKDAEGNFVLEENGGFNEKSNWVTKVDYVALLESVFANKKDEETGKWDKVEEIWTWDVESIKEAKQFVEDEGLGNVEQDDALEKFRARFGPVKTN